jgi:hypothetical protein
MVKALPWFIGRCLHACASALSRHDGDGNNLYLEEMSPCGRKRVVHMTGGGIILVLEQMSPCGRKRP